VHNLESISGVPDIKVKFASGISLRNVSVVLITWAADPLFHEQFVFINSILVIISSSMPTPSIQTISFLNDIGEKESKRLVNKLKTVKPKKEVHNRT